ncbi:hypothetical protein K435DRAFT_874259 [Dendrothele bispora CBS 962.96]|uniref:Uncharacterized protein n=1 Tax=Dendrothele bispora (strain CBS 962.96) TaxID=1314807 RepID=A0A4S8KX51_DENBC|nr:hypothetical protein K435DRAFT_874259 [Dendrothele bispora CBS 962.96]
MSSNGVLIKVTFAEPKASRRAVLKYLLNLRLPQPRLNGIKMQPKGLVELRWSSPATSFITSLQNMIDPSNPKGFTPYTLSGYGISRIELHTPFSEPQSMDASYYPTPPPLPRALETASPSPTVPTACLPSMPASSWQETPQTISHVSSVSSPTDSPFHIQSQSQQLHNTQINQPPTISQTQTTLSQATHQTTNASFPEYSSQVLPLYTGSQILTPPASRPASAQTQTNIASSSMCTGQSSCQTATGATPATEISLLAKRKRKPLDEGLSDRQGHPPNNPPSLSPDIETASSSNTGQITGSPSTGLNTTSSTSSNTNPSTSTSTTATTTDTHHGVIIHIPKDNLVQDLVKTLRADLAREKETNAQLQTTISNMKLVEEENRLRVDFVESKVATLEANELHSRQKFERTEGLLKDAQKALRESEEARRVVERERNKHAEMITVLEGTQEEAQQRADEAMALLEETKSRNQQELERVKMDLRDTHQSLRASEEAKRIAENERDKYACALEDLKREVKEPLMVPALLEVIGMVSDLTSNSQILDFACATRLSSGSESEMSFNGVLIRITYVYPKSSVVPIIQDLSDLKLPQPSQDGVTIRRDGIVEVRWDSNATSFIESLKRKIGSGFPKSLTRDDLKASGMYEIAIFQTVLLVAKLISHHSSSRIVLHTPRSVPQSISVGYLRSESASLPRTLQTPLLSPTTPTARFPLQPASSLQGIPQAFPHASSVSSTVDPPFNNIQSQPQHMHNAQIGQPSTISQIRQIQQVQTSLSQILTPSSRPASAPSAIPAPPNITSSSMGTGQSSSQTAQTATTPTLATDDPLSAKRKRDSLDGGLNGRQGHPPNNSFPPNIGVVSSSNTCQTTASPSTELSTTLSASSSTNPSTSTSTTGATTNARYEPIVHILKDKLIHVQNLVKTLRADLAREKETRATLETTISNMKLVEEESRFRVDLAESKVATLEANELHSRQNLEKTGGLLKDARKALRESEEARQVGEREKNKYAKMVTVLEGMQKEAQQRADEAMALLEETKSRNQQELERVKMDLRDTHQSLRASEEAKRIAENERDKYARALEDLKREVNEPLMVPALLEVIGMVSDLTSELTSQENGAVSVLPILSPASQVAE